MLFCRRWKHSIATSAMLERKASKEALDQLLYNNKKWVDVKLSQSPDYFSKLAQPQKPRYLFIGLEAGNLFVHRNIGNMVVHTDINLLSILQYAIGHLKVRDIIGCGGVAAAMENKDLGLLDHWLLSRIHMDQLSAIKDPQKRNERLIELNVQEQCINLFKNGMVQNFQIKYGFPRIHGLVYDIRNGILRKLDVDFKGYAKKYQSIYSLYSQESPESSPLESRQRDFIKGIFDGDGNSMEANKFFLALLNSNGDDTNPFHAEVIANLMASIRVQDGTVELKQVTDALTSLHETINR